MLLFIWLFSENSPFRKQCEEGLAFLERWEHVSVSVCLKALESFKYFRTIYF